MTPDATSSDSNHADVPADDGTAGAILDWEDFDHSVDLRSLISRDQIQLRHWIGFLGLFLLAILPVLFTPIQLASFIPILFLMMFAISWDVVSGYTGQLSFGHAYFFGIGGYTSTVLNLQHGLSPIPSIVIATIVAGIGGLIIGFPALRLRGPYLSLVTLVVPVIMLQIFTVTANDFIIDIGPFSIPVAPDGLGGTIGLTPADALVSTGENAVVTVSSYASEVLINYYLALGLLFTLTMILFVITRSPVGTLFTAIREDETVVEAVGINPAKYKLYSFVLSGVIGGFAGAVFVHTLAGVAQPQEILSLQLSINVIIYSVIGGMGTIIGPILGVAFFEGSVQFLETLDISIFGVPINELAPLILFVISIGVVMRRPQGLLPALIQEGRKLRARIKDEDDVPEATKRSDTVLWRTVTKFIEELREIADKARER